MPDFDDDEATAARVAPVGADAGDDVTVHRTASGTTPSAQPLSHPVSSGERGRLPVVDATVRFGATLPSDDVPTADLGGKTSRRIDATIRIEEGALEVAADVDAWMRSELGSKGEETPMPDDPATLDRVDVYRLAAIETVPLSPEAVQAVAMRRPPESLVVPGPGRVSSSAPPRTTANSSVPVRTTPPRSGPLVAHGHVSQPPSLRPGAALPNTMPPAGQRPVAFSHAPPHATQAPPAAITEPSRGVRKERGIWVEVLIAVVAFVAVLVPALYFLLR